MRESMICNTRKTACCTRSDERRPKTLSSTVPHPRPDLIVLHRRLSSHQQNNLDIAGCTFVPEQLSCAEAKRRAAQIQRPKPSRSLQFAIPDAGDGIGDEHCASRHPLKECADLVASP